MNSDTTVEINLSDFSREHLEYMIQQSCEQDVSINKIIANMLENMIKAYDDEQHS